MLDLGQIQSYYPEKLKPFKKNMLREYLQYKVLEIIYTSDFAAKLIFMGGTALRLIHANKRFSEDLDFDNKGLGEKDFKSMMDIVEKRMKLEGYNLSIRNNLGNTFRSYIKIHDVMHDLSLTPHKKENVDLRIDTEPQRYEYLPEKPFLNRFDVFTQIFSVPARLILSQKLYAIFNRKRTMGRDFFDVLFLLGKTRPDYGYLNDKMDIANSKQLRSRLLELCSKIDMKSLVKDIRPFVFDQADIIKVELFADYVKNAEL